MIFNKLGRTGLDCSRLGFGTWQLGGGRWKGLERKASVALLQHAADNGINLFDAAVVYGQYHGALNERRSHSLELLGEAFGGERREKVMICLKLGQIDEYSHRAIYTPRVMVDEMHRALLELKTDYVDICLIHAPSLAEVRDERALAILQTLQATGMAKFTGYSFEAEPEHAQLALTQGIDVMMLQYNLIDEECADVFKTAYEQGVGMLVGGPFKRGYLSGQFDQLSDLPLDDNYWAWNVRYSSAKVESYLSRANQFKKQAGGAAQLRKKALHHILQHPGACSAIVGYRTKEEVSENAKTIHEIGEDHSV